MEWCVVDIYSHIFIAVIEQLLVALHLFPGLPDVDFIVHFGDGCTDGLPILAWNICRCEHMWVRWTCDRCAERWMHKSVIKTGLTTFQEEILISASQPSSCSSSSSGTTLMQASPSLHTLPGSPRWVHCSCTGCTAAWQQGTLRHCHVPWSLLGRP